MEKWLIKNGFFLTGLSVIVAAMSYIKEMVFAQMFGVSNIADAYTVAMTMPEVLFAVVWNAMNTILIPMYQNKIQNESRKDANRFISVFFTAIISFCVVFVVFCEFVIDYWIYIFAPGFDVETHNIAVEIARWTFPILFFEGIERVCVGVLQTHKRFVLAKTLSLVRNTLLIISLLLFAKRFGVLAAVVGILTGACLEALIAYAGSTRYEKIQLIIDFKDKSLREAGKLAIPVIIGTGVSELNVLIDKVVASYLEAGSMISLSYASRMEGIITTIVLLNLVSLAFPLFSECVACKDVEKLKSIYEKTLRILIILAVPIVFGGFVLGEDIISIAFLRGAFDYDAVRLVAPLFSVYLAVGLFNTIRTLSVNVFASYGETKQIMYNTIFAVSMNAVFNIVLAYFVGPIGLAVASLLSAIFASSRLIYLINRDKFSIDFQKTAGVFVRIIVSGLLMGAMIYACKELLDKLYVETVIIQIGKVLGLVILGIIYYICMLRLLKIEEVNMIFKFVSKVTGRRKS